MTNATTTSTPKMVRSFARQTDKHSDEAPMLVTRLSGWIDSREGKSVTPTWIIPTRMQAQTR